MQIIEGTDVANGGNIAWLKTILIGDGIIWATRLPAANIAKMGSVFIPNPATYKYDTVTKIRFDLADGSSFDIEVQDVGNQATWNTGTKFALEQALSDLYTWIS